MISKTFRSAPVQMRITAFVLFLFVLPPGNIYSDETRTTERRKVTERRRHFEIKSKDGVRLYEGTEIIRTSDLTDEDHTLVRDEGHGDFVMRRVWNFRDQTVRHRMADVKDRVFLQLVLKMPFTSRTRQETLEEARANPTIAEVSQSLLTLETNGGMWEGTHSEWNDPSRLRSLRHGVRLTLDRFILEAIERGRSLLFSTIEGNVFFSVAGRYAVYDTEVLEATEPAEALGAPASCEFDEAFGYPCSEKQKQRVRKAATDGVILDTY